MTITIALEPYDFIYWRFVKVRSEKTSHIYEKIRYMLSFLLTLFTVNKEYILNIDCTHLYAIKLSKGDTFINLQICPSQVLDI